MKNLRCLIEKVSSKEKDILIKESLLKLLYNLEKNGNIEEDDLNQFVMNLLNRDSALKKYIIKDIVKLSISEKKPKGLSRQYLTKEISRGNLKAELVGRNYLVEEREVKRYLEVKNIFLGK